jgi:murein DD-endopeptidase MepM/ murein hydrolase activator NlpD
MSNYLYPIPFTKEIIKESKYTAFINDILPKLEKILSPEIINKKWPADLRAKPELLQTLRMGWNKKVYLDGSPLTHKEEYNSQNAIDFLVPVGTPVQAINDGKIIYLVDQFNEY